MKMYGSSYSPFVRKVMVYAIERGIELDVVPIRFQDTNPDFRAVSPFGKMPALIDGDFGVADSSAIIAYLEAKFPEGGLIPVEAKARARTVWFEEYADSELAQAVFAIFFNRITLPKFVGRPGDDAYADTFERDQFAPLVDYLETVAPDEGFLVGDNLTLADIAVASPFVNFRHAGVRIDMDRWPRAVAYLARIHERPSFAPIIAKEAATLMRLG